MNIQILKNKKIGYLILLVYLLIGIFIFRDYGIWVDDGMQRQHSLISYKYILSKISDSESSVEALANVQELSTYKHKFYGVALQLPLVLIEHVNGFQMDTRAIFLMRHLYVFLNYVIGCLCFYLILWRRFKGGSMPLLGLLMLILYPRFFGEAFYNIKDMLSVSWYIISVYFSLRFVEDYSLKNVLLFSFSSAVSTNTRLLGISILFLTVAFCILKMFITKIHLKENLKWLLLLCVSFFAFYTVITPASWENPIKFILDTFITFKDFDSWNGRHLYMGELITKDVPWHYIPVWMVITIPTVYSFLFCFGTRNVASDFIKNIKDLKCYAKTNYMYDIFMFLAFWCSLIGLIALNVSLYGYWHHVYFLFIPFLYLAVTGFNHIIILFSNKSLLKKLAFVILISSLISVGGWVVNNHPHQYVYFNYFVRSMVPGNFTRNFWALSYNDAYKHIFSTDTREHITLSARHSNRNFQSQEIRNKISIIEATLGADYHIQAATDNTDTSDEWTVSGYREIYNTSVDGFRLNTLFKYLLDESMFTDDFFRNVKNITSSESRDLNNVLDNDISTRWSTRRPQKEDDFVMIEFLKPVKYNLLRLQIDTSNNDYPRELKILSSIDGEHWKNMKIVWNNRVDYIIQGSEYRYLKLVNLKSDEKYYWSICEMKLGNVDINTIAEILDITVGQYKKRIDFDEAMSDDQFRKDINNMSSNEPSSLEKALDNDLSTRWSTGRPQKADDFITLEFQDPVNYNQLRLQLGSSKNDYPRELKILSSVDGEHWEEVGLIWNDLENYIFESNEYRFLKLINLKADAEYYWSIHELQMGNVDAGVISEIMP